MEDIIIITAAAYQKQTEELLLYKMKAAKLKKKNYDLLTEVDTLGAQLAETKERLAAEEADNEEMAIALHLLNERYQQATQSNIADQAAPDIDDNGIPIPAEYVDDGEPLPY